ncbi:MAG: ExbD/TolR family protein [Planctomycetota bacterium]
MRFRPQRQTSLELDLGPMVDVIFQLLIFFVLTSVAVSASLPLALPQASTAAPQAVQGLEIAVDEQGLYHVADKPVAAATILGILEERLRQEPELALTIRGHKDARHEQVVFLLDVARVVGLKKVRIACDQAAHPLGVKGH